MILDNITTVLSDWEEFFEQTKNMGKDFKDTGTPAFGYFN
jgi:hypothetical protein